MVYSYIAEHVNPFNTVSWTKDLFYSKLHQLPHCCVNQPEKRSKQPEKKDETTREMDKTTRDNDKTTVYQKQFTVQSLWRMVGSTIVYTVACNLEGVNGGLHDCTLSLIALSVYSQTVYCRKNDMSSAWFSLRPRIFLFKLFLYIYIIVSYEEMSITALTL